MEKKNKVKLKYEAPKVLYHENVTFETAISAAGHWEFQIVNGEWMRVFVPG